MTTPDLFQAIEHTIREATGEAFTLRRNTPIGGGCINTTYRVESERQAYFVKLNRQELLPMFEAEAEGLSEIASTQTVRAPLPVGCGLGGDQAFLVLENLSLTSGRGPCDRLLGERLAALHRIQQP